MWSLRSACRHGVVEMAFLVSNVRPICRAGSSEGRGVGFRRWRSAPVNCGATHLEVLTRRTCKLKYVARRIGIHLNEGISLAHEKQQMRPEVLTSLSAPVREAESPTPLCLVCILWSGLQCLLPLTSVRLARGSNRRSVLLIEQNIVQVRGTPCHKWEFEVQQSHVLRI